MAEIIVPDEVLCLTVANESHLDFPNQIVLTSPWTANRSVINRGYPSWVGNFTLGRTDIDSIGLVVESFLSAFEGQGNWASVPVDRPTVPEGISTTITSKLLDNDTGNLTHTLAANTDFFDALQVGMRLKAGDNVYSVRSIDGTVVILDPCLLYTSPSPRDS